MSDDLSTASGGAFYPDQPSSYSDNSTDVDITTSITTTGIDLSQDGGQFAAVEVVTTDAQSVYPGDDAAYMQQYVGTAVMDSQLAESSQSNINSLSTENIELTSSIQSFEDPQQFEQQHTYKQSGENFGTIESSQSFVYTPLDALPSQPESQLNARTSEQTETVTYSHSEIHSQQPVNFQGHAQPGEIMYQDPHPIGVSSHMSQSSQPGDSNPLYIPIQNEGYSDPNMYEQLSSTTVITSPNHPSSNDNLYVGLNQPNMTYSEPSYNTNQSVNVIGPGPAYGDHVTNKGKDGMIAGLTAAMGTTSLTPRSIDTAAAINAGVGMVSTAVNVLSSDTVQGATSTATNALMGDPVAAVQAGFAIAMSGVRIGASIGKWNETRQKRKESHIQLAAVHGATNPVIMSKVAVSTQLDEALLVLSVLGQRLVVLEVVKPGELPQALALCRTACAQADSGDLLEHFDTLDGMLQYAVTAALFFCVGCWPMHIYRGFGTGVLDNFLWGCPHPEYSNGQTAGFKAIDRWISLLKSMPREVYLLTRMPHGLNRLVPTYGKNERMERRRLMNAYKQFVREVEARGHPQPIDRSFRVVSWHIPFATWNSPFTFKSSGHYWEDFLRWQMDPGRLLHAWTIGGHLDLNYGEMMWLPSGVAESVARFLAGLPGTTFKLVPTSALDYSFLRLSPETRRVILEEGFETVKAIRDPQAELRKPAMNQNMFVPAPPPVVQRKPAQAPAPYMVSHARPSGPSGAMVQPSLNHLAAHQQMGSSSAMPNTGNPHMAHSAVHQNLQQPLPSRPNGSMLPQHMSNLAAAQQSAHSSASPFPASPNTSAHLVTSPISNPHPNSRPAMPHHQTPTWAASQGTMPHQQRLSSMPNIHSSDSQGHPINPQSMGHHPNLQRVPSMPISQPAGGPTIHPAQQPEMHATQSNINQTPHQSSPTSIHSLDAGQLERSTPMDGFSMQRPQLQSPSNPDHSMSENPHINPLTRRSTNPPTLPITEGQPTINFHPFPPNAQVHSPKSSVSRTSTVSSRHSGSSQSGQAQSSVSSYASQLPSMTSPLSPNSGTECNPLPLSAHTPSQYPFPPTQQPVAQSSKPIKRRPAPPPPPPPQPIMRKVKAIHPFEPVEANELKFAVGDLLDVLNDDTDDGWWEARLNGKIGSIPASYVEDV